jgi:hypothetical protein
MYADMSEISFLEEKPHDEMDVLLDDELTSAEVMEQLMRDRPTTKMRCLTKKDMNAALEQWNTYVGTPSGAIANVLQSLGYLGFSVRCADDKVLIETIVEKYMQTKLKTPESIATFLKALRKVRYQSYLKERRAETFQLLATFNQANSFTEIMLVDALHGVVGLGLHWYELDEQLRRKILQEFARLQDSLHITSIFALQYLFFRLIDRSASEQKEKGEEEEEETVTLKKIVAQLDMRKENVPVAKFGTFLREIVNVPQLSSEKIRIIGSTLRTFSQTGSQWSQLPTSLQMLIFQVIMKWGNSFPSAGWQKTISG